MAFFRHFHKALAARGLTLKGITTDGSPLYPEPIAAVFGQIPHQLCTFHIIREVTKAVLSALAKEASGWPPPHRSCRVAVLGPSPPRDVRSVAKRGSRTR